VLAQNDATPRDHLCILIRATPLSLQDLKMSITLTIPWIKSANDVHEVIIKWSRDNAKCEMCSALLEDLELKTLMPHCLAVKTQINQVVTIDAIWVHRCFECFQGQHLQHFERSGTSSLLMKIRRILKRALVGSSPLI
jgi:hypothetical protein